MARQEVRARREATREEYARLAAVYETRWARYVAHTTEATLRPLTLAAGDRLLDVGCGTGELLARVRARWPGAVTVGVDLSPEMLAAARERLGSATALVEADAHALPFGDRSFDAVVSNSSLHYWSDPGRCAAELARVLRAGGVLIVTDWSADYLPTRVLGYVLAALGRAHARTYRAAELVELLEAAGFRVSIERDRLGWLWGLMTARALRA